MVVSTVGLTELACGESKRLDETRISRPSGRREGQITPEEKDQKAQKGRKVA
jgi:hypothetical protein